MDFNKHNLVQKLILLQLNMNSKMISSNTVGAERVLHFERKLLSHVIIECAHWEPHGWIEGQWFNDWLKPLVEQTDPGSATNI